MSSSHPVMFPPEIFTEIFSFLASETRVLIACSRAHPIIAQLVEPTLYAHVVVHSYDADLEDEHHLMFKPHRLSTLLSGNPRILNYLRSLCVELPELYSDGFMEDIIAILGRLKLERIRLTHNFEYWHWLPIAFRTAFVACISTPFMKEISIDGISDISLSSFADCPGLRRLTLWYDAIPPSNQNSRCNFPHLEALELSYWMIDDGSHDFLSWPQTQACGLRSLTFTTFQKSVLRTFLPRVLGICSTSLVNLNIYYTNTHGADVGPIDIDFPGLPSLERLCLCIYASCYDYLRRALITATEILQKFSSIKHLTIIICLRFKGKEITRVDWSPLTDFLFDRRSSFQHTDLHIRAKKAGGEVSSDEVISMLSRYEKLVNLVEAGYVSIKKEKYLDVHVNGSFKNRTGLF